MKKFLFLAIFGLFFSANLNFGFAEENHGKILVAYFSRAGEEYSIGNVAKGNTKIIAEIISQKVGGDLFEIKPVKNYPVDYNECTKIASHEKAVKARPEIFGEVENFEQYDTIFLGYPNWWGDLPMIIYTFLEKNNFSGKKIIPFCTSASENFIGKDFIENSAKGSTVLEGLGIRGKRCQENPESVRQYVNEWLKNLKF